MMVTPNDVYLPRSQPPTTRRDVNEPSWFIQYFCGCCCCLIPVYFLLVISTIIINLQGGIALISEIPTIEIDSFAVSNLNLSKPMSAHWNINMSMHNTDSSFEFSDATISVFHESKQEALWTTTLKKFDMRPKNSTFHFALDFWGLDDATVRVIVENITNNYGAVRFYVRFNADHPKNYQHIYRIMKVWFRNKVNTVVIDCEVLLRFKSLDKTQANMLKTDSQACY